MNACERREAFFVGKGCVKPEDTWFPALQVKAEAQEEKRRKFEENRKNHYKTGSLAELRAKMMAEMEDEDDEDDEE